MQGRRSAGTVPITATIASSIPVLEGRPSQNHGNVKAKDRGRGSSSGKDEDFGECACFIRVTTTGIVKGKRFVAASAESK